jgi:hypothetical protein
VGDADPTNSQSVLSRDPGDIVSAENGPFDLTPVASTVTEISRLQEEIRDRGKRIHLLAAGIVQRTRRSTSDDTTAIYLTYANVMTRFAGSIDQISMRASRSSRILERISLIEAEKEGEMLMRQRRERKAQKEAQSKAVQRSPMESLIDLYGQDLSIGE